MDYYNIGVPTHATFSLFQTRIFQRIFAADKKNCHFMLIRAEIGEIGKKFEKKYADCRWQKKTILKK